MEFRKAQLSDAEAIFSIEGLVQPNPWTLKHVIAEIQVAQSIVAVLENGQLEGYVFYRGSQGQYDLTNIAVAPSNFGKGLARQLVDQMTGQIARQGISGDKGLNNQTNSVNKSFQVLLEVSDKNLKARRFYEKCGFKTLSIRPRYYSDGSDGVVMTLRIAKN